MSRKSHHVVPAPNSGWNVKKGGSKRSSGHFDRKTDAVDWARKVSRNQNSELVIHNKNGKIGNSDSHGHDSCPPKDRN